MVLCCTRNQQFEINRLHRRINKDLWTSSKNLGMPRHLFRSTTVNVKIPRNTIRKRSRRHRSFIHQFIVRGTCSRKKLVDLVVTVDGCSLVLRCSVRGNVFGVTRRIRVLGTLSRLIWHENV